MPASEYPELRDMPAGCIEVAPWTTSPIGVRGAYGPVDEVVIQQDPLVSIDWPKAQFEMFAGEQRYDRDSPPGELWEGGGIGYESPEEMAALNYFTPMASATASNVAFYHPDAKDTIVALASEAENLFREIRQAYKEYKPGGSIQYPLKATGKPGSIPLLVQDMQFNIMVDLSKVHPKSLEWRHETRQNIRDAYHKALHLLWCALYGKNQSLAWRENRKIYGEKYGPTGPGLAPTPLPGPRPPPGIPWTEIGVTPPEPIPPPPPVEPPPVPPGYPGEAPEEVPVPEGYPPETIPEELPPEEYPPAPPPTKKRRAAAGAGIAIAVVALIAVVAAKK